MIERRVELRWRDLDALGHVTHSVVLTYLEEGRNAWLARHGIGAESYVVVSAKVDYRREITPDQRAVRARCRVASVGTTSVTTAEQLVADDGAVLADAAFVLVMWDPERRGSRPLTAAERAGLELELEQGRPRAAPTAPPTRASPRPDG